MNFVYDFGLNFFNTVYVRVIMLAASNRIINDENSGIEGEGVKAGLGVSDGVCVGRRVMPLKA